MHSGTSVDVEIHASLVPEMNQSRRCLRRNEDIDIENLKVHMSLGKSSSRIREDCGTSRWL